MILLNFKKFIPLFLTVCILISVIAVSASTHVKAPSDVNNPTPTKAVSTTDTVQKAMATADSIDVDDEMRGVWVTYMELDMQNEKDKSKKSFEEKFNKIADKCKDSGFNTLIVQVRPFCDALYKSEYFPWSHILTGTQGKNPGYDALEIMCDISKKNNLKIHAWINPYRIIGNETPNNLSENNPYSMDKSLGKKTENGIYFDPSNTQAQKLIIDGIQEIVENYNVDGIQFDDYFYPTQNENFDKEEYESYVEKAGENNSMNLDNWRTANVNMLVCQAYRTVHNTKDNVVFGISPQGNINNNDGLYADVKTWCNCKGFIDYICPQIYFSLTNPALTFENSLQSWCDIEYYEGVKLYVGLAGYKAGTDDDENSWLDDNNILAQEYNIVKSNKRASGIMLYSYSSIENEDAQEEIDNLIKSFN